LGDIFGEKVFLGIIVYELVIWKTLIKATSTLVF